MLVLTRKIDQQIQIGPHITVTILQVKGKSVRVGIAAPRDVNVLRQEVAERDAAEAQFAPASADSEISASLAPATSTERCPAVTGALPTARPAGMARHPGNSIRRRRLMMR